MTLNLSWQQIPEGKQQIYSFYCLILYLYSLHSLITISIAWFSMVSGRDSRKVEYFEGSKMYKYKEVPAIKVLSEPMIAIMTTLSHKQSQTDMFAQLVSPPIMRMLKNYNHVTPKFTTITGNSGLTACIETKA